MKLNSDARLPQGDSVLALKQRISELQRETAALVNAISAGQMSGTCNAATAAPTAGAYALGDFVRNSAPAELGVAGSQYVIAGWTCLVAPLTFVESRFLTGN